VHRPRTRGSARLSAISRLRAILDGLSKQTGVIIRAGVNTKDWQARDIPVFVSVRDLPLGKLLSALSDAAHVQLTSQRMEADEDRDKTYRLYRSKSYQDSITQPAQDKLTKGMELANWSWDALVACSRMATPPPLQPTNDYTMDGRQAVLIGKILASLSEDSKQRIFAGEPCSLTTRQGLQADLVKQLQQVAWEKLKLKRPPDNASQTPDPDKAVLIINIYQVKSDGYTGFHVNMGGLPDYTITVGNSSTTQTGQWLADCMESAKPLQDVKELNLPKRPEAGPSRMVEDPVPTGFKPLKTDEDWNAPALQTKVTIKRPAKPEDWRLCDLLTQVAEASGLGIVCQDIRSHQTTDHARVDFSLSDQPTAAQALRAMQSFNWYLDEQRKLLVGWESSWRMLDKALVPEATVTGLAEKLASAKGVEIDDYMPVVKLNMLQDEYWIWHSRELGCLYYCMSTIGKPLWLLYDSLSPEDRALARSEAGLPMNKMDPAWAAGFLQQEFEKRTKGSYALSADGDPPGYKTMRRVAADPDVIAKSILRVTPTSLMQSYRTREGDGPWKTVEPPPLKPGDKHFYKIELTGKADGEDFNLSDTIRVGFPVHKGDRPEGSIIRVGSDSNYKVNVKNGGYKTGNVTVIK